ncbi:MAG: bifunctional 4-hydroxy-3-methylbut-2-enyl diphosphate reductase/30S ribosomal protein S1 [Christensenellales bacterium]
MVILAKNAGFCFGVKRAVDAVETHIGENIVTLGPLIHNRDVVRSLEKRGVACIERVEDVPEGAAVVIRSHGASPEVYDALKTRGIAYIDATCPFVKRIHERVRAAAEAGQRVIIVGEKGHPEVIGTIGWAGSGAFVVNSEEEVAALPHMDEAVVVAQTTITQEKWEQLLAALESRVERIIPFMSICSATQQRQEEAAEIAKIVDTIIVVGGRQSSNTRKLYELCRKSCKNVYHIEHKNELLLEKMHLGDIIGIVSGASTPDTMIREVFDYMMENEKALQEEGEDIPSQETAASDMAGISAVTQIAEEVPVDKEPGVALDPTLKETVEATVDTANEVVSEATATDDMETAQVENNAPAKQSDEKNEFLEGLEKVVRLKKGQIVKGNIVQITDEDVYVNIGYKSDGIIPKSELSLHDINPKDVYNIGDEIEAEVINLNDGEGNILLSRKRVEKKLNWLKIQQNVGTDILYKCVVKKAVKGGVTTKIEGYNAFIPASQLSLKYVEDLKQFEGQELEVTLIDADKKQERLVASHKTVLLKEKKEKEKALWESLKKGDRVKGVVKRLTDFGAFVDVGGVDGLLHISDMAWARVKHPTDVVSEGQEMELVILNVDPSKKRIALGYKQLLPKPWDLVPEKYHAGDIVRGKVVRIVPFGAFVQLEPTVDGLIHISQVSNRRLDKVEDELRIGDEIEAKVLEVNADKRKISLSRRALMPVEERPAKKANFDQEEDFHYEIPPVQESTVSLAEFFPKKDD